MDSSLLFEVDCHSGRVVGRLVNIFSLFVLLQLREKTESAINVEF